MHRCLWLDDIVRPIAFELIADGGQATAVSLACSCKRFEDLVLDELWGVQDQLVPLLKILPGDIWNPGEYDVSPAITILILSLLNRLNCKSLKRPPTKQEWDRLWIYAQKMQRLSSMDPWPLQVFSVLQFRTSGKPLLPNLRSLDLWYVTGDPIPFIPLVLSARTTTIDIMFSELGPHNVATASMIANFPTFCPALREIRLICLPRDPMMTAAVSELVLTTNQNTLRHFHASSPLTEEAHEVIYRLPVLRELWTVIVGPTLLPTMMLQNLTDIDVDYNHNHDWLQGFREASLGKLASITIHSQSESIGDFLGAFESVALTTSIPTTLLKFRFHTDRSWEPRFRSLLPFTQLTTLLIDSNCETGCSSTIDDDTITELAQAMPELGVLQLCDRPCETPAGVTVKGLAALAYYCPRLSYLAIHFQVASLDPPEIPSPVSADESTVPREPCELRSLQAGHTRVPEESALMVALTLINIFPCLEDIVYLDMGWERVANAIQNSKRLARCSSKKSMFVALRSSIDK